MTDRERALVFIESGIADWDGPAGKELRTSLLAPFGRDELYRVWAFIESFRPEGDPPRNYQNFHAEIGTRT